ncbi:MAG: glycosyltransferase [bacterium]
MATAKALQSAAEMHPSLNFKVEVIDFSEEVNKLFNTASKRIYEMNAKHTPIIHKWIYDSTDRSPLPIRFMNMLNYPIKRKALVNLISEHNPKLIISNYPIWQYIAYSATKQFFDVEFATLVTDSITVHSAWVLPDSDFYLVANEPTAASLHNLGVANNKIFPLGYPVHEAFTKPVDTAAVADLKLGKKDRLIVISASSLRLSYLKRLLKAVANVPDTIYLVITGRDTDLAEGLKPDNFTMPDNCIHIGWTTKMPEYIKRSSLVITKAGGSTVMECIAARKPMIINKVIPGQEEGNAELVDRYNLGAVVSKPLEIRQAIETILADPEGYTERLTKLARPDASNQILEFLRDRLDKHKA